MNCFRLSTRLRAADAKRHEGKGCDQQTSRRCRSGSLLITRHSQRTMTVQGQKQPPETRVSHAFLQLLFGLSAASWTKTWNPDFETQSELQKASFCSLPSVRLGLVCRMSRSFCAEAEHDKKRDQPKLSPDLGAVVGQGLCLAAETLEPEPPLDLPCCLEKGLESLGGTEKKVSLSLGLLPARCECKSGALSLPLPGCR